MEPAGHLKTLAERMREKAGQERMETEKLFAEELANLRKSLLASSQNALHTMTAAMEAEIAAANVQLSRHCQTLSMACGRAWMRTAITALAMLLGLAAGGWTLMRGAAYWLDGYRRELAHLQEACREQRETLANLKSETWSLELLETEDGRFIVLPPGANPSERPWTVGNRKAIRLE